MKAIVIGGGIIGVSTAFRLAQKGVRVTLLEARKLASGATGTSFAWVNSNNKAPLAYHRLNVAGMTEHAAVREEFGQAPWLHVDGNVAWEEASDPPGANEPAVPVGDERWDDKLQRFHDWNYPVELLSPAELAAIHPDVVVPAGVDRVAYFPLEGFVDAPLLVATLAGAAEALGVAIETGQEVAEIVQEGGRVVGVRTTAGQRYAADVVVSCAGRWTDRLTALAGHPVPMAPTPGLLVLSQPVPTRLRCLVHTRAVNLRPAGGSRVLMASYGHDDLLDPATPPETVARYAEEVRERAARVLPALAGSTVASFTVGVRAIPRDGFPVVGPLAGLEGFYLIATHSGVTMGPLLGRLAAREIVDGVRDDRLARFRPDRLLAEAGAIA